MLFSVLDAKVGAFAPPWAQMSENAAIRTFSDDVNNSQDSRNMWNRHPEDYSLFAVGEFNTETGELIPSTPKALVNASALKAIAATLPTLNGQVMEAVQ